MTDPQSIGSLTPKQWEILRRVLRASAPVTIGGKNRVGEVASARSLVAKGILIESAHSRFAAATWIREMKASLLDPVPSLFD